MDLAVAMRVVARRVDARTRSKLKGLGRALAAERAAARWLASEGTEEEESARRRETKRRINSRGVVEVGEVGVAVKVIQAGRWRMREEAPSDETGPSVRKLLEVNGIGVGS